MSDQRTNLGNVIYQHTWLFAQSIECECGWESEGFELGLGQRQHAEHVADMVRAYLRDRPVLRQVPVEQPEDDEDPQTIAQRVKALLPPSLRAMWWGGL